VLPTLVTRFHSCSIAFIGGTAWKRHSLPPFAISAGMYLESRLLNSACRIRTGNGDPSAPQQVRGSASELSSILADGPEVSIWEVGSGDSFAPGSGWMTGYSAVTCSSTFAHAFGVDDAARLTVAGRFVPGGRNEVYRTAELDCIR